MFFERGRRTRKAVEAYLSKAKKRLFVNSDGCPIYKCYDVTVKDLEKCSEITDISIRVSCLVHMRRPFFKLKDCSQDAIDIVHLADEVFRNHSFFVGSPCFVASRLQPRISWSTWLPISGNHKWHLPSIKSDSKF